MGKVKSFLERSYIWMFDEEYDKTIKKKKALKDLNRKLIKQAKKLKKEYKNNKKRSIKREYIQTLKLLKKSNKHLKSLK